QLTIEKFPGERAYCYTLAEVQAMVRHCRANPDLDWLHSVIVGLARTGMRISELASLRWSDIDLKRGLVMLTDETGVPVRRGKLRRELKTKRSRTIQMHKDVADLLADLGDRPGKGTLVFHGPRRGRLKPDTVRLALIRDVIMPLSPQFPPHD